jgi:hypothetical protein
LGNARRLNSDLRRQADSALSKASRATQFDVAKCIRTDTITFGLEHAISSGNWTIKRFRMDRKGVTQVGSVSLWVWSLSLVGFCGQASTWAIRSYATRAAALYSLPSLKVRLRVGGCFIA